MGGRGVPTGKRITVAPLAMAEAALESLERAVQEVEALDAIFGYEDGGFTLHSEGALSEARSATEAAASARGPMERTLAS